jgi:hypothetical protein
MDAAPCSAARTHLGWVDDALRQAETMSVVDVVISRVAFAQGSGQQTGGWGPPC